MAKPQEMTAVHEAAHAVVGHLLGYRVLRIKFCAGEKKGHAGFSLRSPPRQRRLIEEASAIIGDIEAVLWIVVGLAGIEAEIQHCPEASFRKWSAMLARGIWPSEYGEIRRTLCPERSYSQADVDVMIPALSFAARVMVEDNWPQITALAEALPADGRIVRHREMMRILGRRQVPMRHAIFMIAWLVVGARLAWSAPGRA